MSRPSVTVVDVAEQKTLYREQNPRSAELWERAKAYMPGGNTRATVFLDPHPLYFERGEGAYVYDVDGHRRLDLNNNQFAIILGHANPATDDAMRSYLGKGNAFAAPTEHEIRLAQLICERAPAAFERVRFCNSGTEATMNAIRVAKAYTGKRKFAKFEGGYHGTHDSVEISVSPPLDGRAGPADAPLPVIGSTGISSGVANDVVILPWNNIEAVERIVRENKDDLAAVIAEPMLGASGLVTPAPGFLRELRRITEENGVLLIFDEVITFRLAPGGGQEYFDIQGDLTTTGKIIGGGLPVGAFGGKAEVMEITDLTSPRFKLRHSGTFQANPLTMIGGAAALEQLTPEVYERINGMGERVRTSLKSIFKRAGVPAQITGAGSLFAIHFTSQPIRDHRDTRTVDAKRTDRFFWFMLNNGVVVMRSLRCALTVAMQDADLDLFLGLTEEFVQAEAAM